MDKYIYDESNGLWYELQRGKGFPLSQKLVGFLQIQDVFSQLVFVGCRWLVLP